MDPVLTGHAVRYRDPMPDGAGGLKMFLPGCFADALSHGRIAALHNHDWSRRLGCTKSETLVLDDNVFWLRFRITFGDVGDASNDRLADVMLANLRGECNGASIGWVHRESYRDRDGVLCIKRADLDEVSVLPRAIRAGPTRRAGGWT